MWLCPANPSRRKMKKTLLMRLRKSHFQRAILLPGRWAEKRDVRRRVSDSP